MLKYCAESWLLCPISEHYCCNTFTLTQHTRDSIKHSCVQANMKKKKKDSYVKFKNKIKFKRKKNGNNRFKESKE